jgi:hypothetical protein
VGDDMTARAPEGKPFNRIAKKKRDGIPAVRALDSIVGLID